MSNPHYIAMAGLKGYLPNVCQSFEDRLSAVTFLHDIHNLPYRKITELKREGYIDLDLHRYGNEYCEITECDCDNPEIHNDM